MRDLTSIWRVLPACGLALVLAGVLAGQAATSGAGAAPGSVVLRVGQQTVTAREFDALIAGLPEQERAAAAAHKREVANEYAQVLAMDQEAERRQLDRGEAFAMQMRLSREKALADALIANLRTAAQPSAADVQAYYTSHQNDFEQVRARHILVADSGTPRANSHRTKAAAKAKIDAIAASLKRGESFATLAKEDSDDPGSKAKGGELGYISHGQTVPQFDSVLWSLKPGQVSAPFESPFGFHIVQVEERRTVPLADVKDQIASQMASAKVRQELTAITAAAKPQLNEAYFGPAPAPAPATPAAPPRK